MIEFGDEAIKPEHLAINGESFDARQNIDQRNAMTRLAESFEDAQTQLESVARGERFAGVVIINDVPTGAEIQGSVGSSANPNCSARDRPLAAVPQLLTPEDIFNQIQQRMRATLGVQP